MYKVLYVRRNTIYSIYPPLWLTTRRRRGMIWSQVARTVSPSRTTIFESIISPTILKLEQCFFSYCVQNLLLYKCYGIHLAILGLFFFLLSFVLKSHIYFQKSTHISHKIPESQNAIHNICKVGNSERNKTNPIVLTSKLWDFQAISFGK